MGGLRWGWMCQRLWDGEGTSKLLVAEEKGRKDTTVRRGSSPWSLQLLLRWIPAPATPSSCIFQAPPHPCPAAPLAATQVTPNLACCGPSSQHLACTTHIHPISMSCLPHLLSMFPASVLPSFLAHLSWTTAIAHALGPQPSADSLQHTLGTSAKTQPIPSHLTSCQLPGGPSTNSLLSLFSPTSVSTSLSQL